MGKVHRLPSTDDAEREASTWFARMNADDVTPDDRARFEAWLGANTVNAKAYSELSDTWQELVKSGPLVRAVYFGQVMNAAASPPARRRRWAVAAVAAGVAAMALGVTWNLYRQKVETRFQTAIGEQAAVALPDGSSFDLIPTAAYGSTTATASVSSDWNGVKLFFKVAHDTQRPVLGARG